ncbi:MAG: hypothetical protein N4A70_19020 [Pelagimonas sp.]|jgi:hypothetical protein|nr:hypothetical protein [Pelagimonas sp.]
MTHPKQKDPRSKQSDTALLHDTLSLLSETPSLSAVSYLETLLDRTEREKAQ